MLPALLAPLGPWLDAGDRSALSVEEQYTVAVAGEQNSEVKESWRSTVN